MDTGGTSKDKLTETGLGLPSTGGAHAGQGDASPPQPVPPVQEDVPVSLGSRQEDQSEDPANASSDEEILNVRIRPGRRGGGFGGDGAGEAAPFELGGRRRRSQYTTRNLTQGSVPGNLLFLAWPQVVEGVLNVVDQMADLFWAGRGVGAKAIAGLGVAQSYTQLIMTGRQGLDIGMQAMVARAIGAGRVGLANHVVLQAFTLSSVAVLLTVVVGVFLTDFLMRVLGVSQEVIGVASLYMKIQFIGFGTAAFRMMSGGALQAAGDSLTPMKATMLTRVTHIILGPLLFFGVGPLPTMGLAGLALGNVLAQCPAVVWNFSALFAGTSRLHLTLRGYYTDWPLLARLVRLGAPAIFTGMERSLVQLLLVRMVTSFGDYALAAYALTRRAENFSQLGSQGLGRSAGILVGQNLGAGSESRAKTTMSWALSYVMLLNGIIGFFLLAFPALFVSIFNQEPELLATAVIWVRLQAIASIVMGGNMVFQQSFSVAGDTVAPMVVTLVSMVFVELPLAFALAYWTPLGQYGIPTAVAVAMGLRTLLYLIYYFMGQARWLRVKVLD
ncbi:MAG: MATE family efflux transporter [Chloroflexota bacterium]